MSVRNRPPVHLQRELEIASGELDAEPLGFLNNQIADYQSFRIIFIASIKTRLPSH